MLMQTADNEHDGSVRGIAVGNQLGEGIRAASFTRRRARRTVHMMTYRSAPIKNPAARRRHVQFQSKIAWKLVWVPGELGDFSRFVLVDDAGTSLTPASQPGTSPISWSENTMPNVERRQIRRVREDYE